MFILAVLSFILTVSPVEASSSSSTVGRSSKYSTSYYAEKLKQADEDILINVDGCWMKGYQYLEKYGTAVIFDEKTGVVTKGSPSIVSKKHHRHHTNIYSQIWHRCDTCGLYICGYDRLRRHSERTGHTRYHRANY